MRIADWLRRLLSAEGEGECPSGEGEDAGEEATAPPADEQPDDDDPTTYPLW